MAIVCIAKLSRAYMWVPGGVPINGDRFANQAHTWAESGGVLLCTFGGTLRLPQAVVGIPSEIPHSDALRPNVSDLHGEG